MQISGESSSRLDREAKMSSNSINVFELARSMAVPNVQELAGTDQISERYFRPEVEAAWVASSDDVELPVIDLTKLLDPELINQEELSNLGFACREWGFFQLINHGVPEEVIEKTKDDIMKFFKLPLKEKEAVKQLPGHFEGYGQKFVHSDEQKLDWVDALVLRTQPFVNRDIRFWPASPTTFRDTLDAYTRMIAKVADCLYRLMAKDLGVDPQVMLDIFGSEQVQTVGINYYPPCKQAKKVLGLSPHSDGSALTVLLQANDVNGLQIKKKDKWLLIKPQPGAFIINIGDLMKIMTNGKYESIEHRVIINMEEERVSIATFHSPSLDVILCPFPGLVNPGGELYKTLSVEEYRTEYFSNKRTAKNTLESIKLRT